LFHVVILPNSNFNCLLVTCAAAADVGLHVDATAYVFQLKILSMT